MIVVDFETRSRADLPKVGSLVYARDPSTDILCMSFKIHGAPTLLWERGAAFPVVLAECISDGETLYAWNAAFEIDIWNEVATRRYDWPVLPIGQWHCLMADAAAMGLPQGLAACSEAMGIGDGKHAAGYAAMMKLCRPNARGDFVEIADDLQLYADLYKYCIIDTDLEAAIGAKLRRIQ